mgnify:CR=1 FL=1
MRILLPWCRRPTAALLFNRRLKRTSVAPSRNTAVASGAPEWHAAGADFAQAKHSFSDGPAHPRPKSAPALQHPQLTNTFRQPKRSKRPAHKSTASRPGCGWFCPESDAKVGQRPGVTRRRSAALLWRQGASLTSAQRAPSYPCLPSPTWPAHRVARPGVLFEASQRPRYDLKCPSDTPDQGRDAYGTEVSGTTVCSAAGVLTVATYVLDAGVSNTCTATLPAGSSCNFTCGGMTDCSAAGVLSGYLLALRGALRCRRRPGHGASNNCTATLPAGSSRNFTCGGGFTVSAASQITASKVTATSTHAAFIQLG